MEYLSTIENRFTRLGIAVAAVATAAACQGSSASLSPEKKVPSSQMPSSESSTEPFVSAPADLEDCDSIRAVQPGEYFNKDYAEHIDEQLDLMRVAYSPNSNVDIDHDIIFRYIPMLHAMENDPMYASAMKRASVMLQNEPTLALSANEMLGWSIQSPDLCAPERLTDEESSKQLAITGDVGLSVGKALLQHLAEQGTRGATLLADYLTEKMDEFGDYLNKQAERLSSSQLSSE